MTPADILRKAKAELQRRGWYQGDLGPRHESQDTCRVCVLGALNCGAGGIPRLSPFLIDPLAQRALRNARSILSDAIGTWPADWNDTPSRTEAEVIAALDKAIALAESEAA